jgi:hypothetical protein
VHDRSLGDLLIHRDVVLDGLDAPQRAARTVLADVLDGKAEDQLFDAMPVASELIANATQHSSGAVLIRVEVYEFGAALGVVDRGADITAVLSDLRTRLLTKGRWLQAGAACSSWTASPVHGRSRRPRTERSSSPYSPLQGPCGPVPTPASH